jgi:hypothetical protein
MDVRLSALRCRHAVSLSARAKGAIPGQPPVRHPGRPAADPGHHRAQGTAGRRLCLDLAMREYRALLDGRMRLIADTGWVVHGHGNLRFEVALCVPPTSRMPSAAVRSCRFNAHASELTGVNARAGRFPSHEHRGVSTSIRRPARRRDNRRVDARRADPSGASRHAEEVIWPQTARKRSRLTRSGRHVDGALACRAAGRRASRRRIIPWRSRGPAP